MRCDVLLIVFTVLAACERAPQPPPEPAPVEKAPVEFLLADDGTLSFRGQPITDPEFETIVDKSTRLEALASGRGHRERPRLLRVLLRAAPDVPVERQREVVGVVLSQRPRDLRVVFGDDALR